MSTIKATTLSTQSNATVPIDTVVNGTAKAWVNFNGTGTVAIRASFNVSSITDNGTGNYTVNFTTAMPDANYSTSLSGSNGTGAGETYVTETFGGTYTKTTTAYRISVYNYNTTSGADRDQVSVVIFR